VLGWLAVVLVVSAASLLSPGAAAAGAHGPCNCTSPAVAEAGDKVRTGEAYKVIWNPAPSDFTGPTPEGLESGYRPEAPTEVVVDRPRDKPAKHPSFRVPSATPPEIYLVLMFDGSEGGTHSTWDYVQIRGRPEATSTASGDSSSDDGGAGQGALAAAFGVGVCASLVSLVLLRRRRANGG
jgi:hypothetical protein